MAYIIGMYTTVSCCLLALLKLDFLTSAYNKCIALVRKSSFSEVQGLHETGP